MPRSLLLHLINRHILLTLFLSFGSIYTTTVYASESVNPRPYYRMQLLSGFTKAKQTVQVSSEVAGKCLAIHAQIGTKVPKSGILAEIDDTFINLDMQANRLELESVQRQLQTEEKTLGRYTTLLEKNSATEAKLDEVTLRADLHEMTIKSLNSKYKRLQQTLARHTISAPVGWTLIERMIEPGEYVQPGETIANIGDYSELIINLALSYNELRTLRQQDTISLYFPDVDLETTAKIHRVSPTFAESTKKIPVELIIKNNHNENSIRGGLRAELYLKQKEEAAFIVPLSAVINRYDAHWIVKENNERIKVLLLGNTENNVSAVISSEALTESDKIYKTIPENF